MKRYALLGMLLGLLLGFAVKEKIGYLQPWPQPAHVIIALGIGGYFAISFARNPHRSSALMAGLFIACGIALYV